jgi:beta-carotene hydroxylase
MVFAPLFAFSNGAFRVLPLKIRTFFTRQESKEMITSTEIKSGKYTLRYWLLTTVLIIAGFFFGIGWESLLLWYLPARISFGWLLFVFAWYPHHPATNQGRYVDTRVAVFPGSTLLTRGHDYHALHHLFPRVPHYRLPKLWTEIGPKLIPKGVRTEGRALGANGSIIWN